MKSQQYKQGHIEAWKSSGMSQAAYCRKQGLNVKTFGCVSRNTYCFLCMY